jgi:hypothetical protein
MMRTKASSTSDPKREVLQQYWHEGGSTGIYARTTLRTLQFSSAIIVIGIYGSSLHYRSKLSSTPITNEIYALVVSLLSVFTLGLHCLLTVKRVPFVLWDFVMCVLWAALAGLSGKIYLTNGELARKDQVKSLAGMKAGIAFALLSMVFWLLTFLQGCIWCCRARRFTRKTDVSLEMGPREQQKGEAGPSVEVAGRDRADSNETILCAASSVQNKNGKSLNGNLTKVAC